jgi:hypothetical protein
MVDGNPDLALSKVYDDPQGASGSDLQSPNYPQVEEDEEDDEEAVVNSDGSVDMEEMLK